MNNLKYGSEKQISWSESLRNKLVEKFNVEKAELTEEGIVFFNNIIEKCEDCKVFIDTRNEHNSIDDFLADFAWRYEKSYAKSYMA